MVHLPDLPMGRPDIGEAVFTKRWKAAFEHHSLCVGLEKSSLGV